MKYGKVRQGISDQRVFLATQTLSRDYSYYCFKQFPSHRNKANDSGKALLQNLHYSAALYCNYQANAATCLIFHREQCVIMYVVKNWPKTLQNVINQLSVTRTCFKNKLDWNTKHYLVLHQSKPQNNFKRLAPRMIFNCNKVWLGCGSHHLSNLILLAC